MPWSEEWMIELDRKHLDQVLGRLIFHLAQEGVSEIERRPILAELEEEFARLAARDDKPCVVRVFCSISESRVVTFGVEPLLRQGARKGEGWTAIKLREMASEERPWWNEAIFPISVHARHSGADFLDEVLEELERRGIAEKEIFGVHLALEEALVNSIKSPEKPHALRAVCRITAGSVEFHLELLFPPPPSTPWKLPKVVWSHAGIVSVGENASGKIYLDSVLAELERQRFSAKDIFRMHMALEEALVNALKSEDRPHAFALRVVCRILATGMVDARVEKIDPLPPGLR